MDTRVLSIIGLLLVIFIGAMLGNSGIVGYSSVKTLNEYPYEGFDQIQSKFEKRKEAFGPMENKKKYAEAFAAMENKKKYAEAFGPMDDKKKYAEAFAAMESPAIKVSGFSKWEHTVTKKSLDLCTTMSRIPVANPMDIQIPRGIFV